MTAYRILHQETDDPDRWRLADDVVEAHSREGAIRKWVKAHDTTAEVIEGSRVYTAVPVRSWVPRTAEEEAQTRLVVS